jgi:DNA-binding winged helix-turn-helix (wHTH) protein/tetratricopeptide (TPR) repeat protein
MLYRVDQYVLDLRKFELRKDGCPVPAEPQVLSLLFLLVENRDRLVSKDELIDAIWDGRAVSDSAISSRIKTARKLLGDDGDAQRLIRTVHGKGFRFVGPVSEEETMVDGIVLDAHAPAEARKRPILIPTLGVAALVLIGTLLWAPWQTKAVTVTVEPASASQESEALARDFTAKLGMMTGVNDGAMRLLDRTGSEKADLRFHVDASAEGPEIASNLVLLDRRGELLWSKGFRQPRAKLSDLKQQLAYTGGKVLDCTLETIAERKPRLDPQVVKLYLNACAAYADQTETNIFDIERTFEKVVEVAPRFQPGWRSLLLAEASTLDDYYEPTEADLGRARKILAAAQKINPAMPEIPLLQSGLAPQTAMTDRMRFLEMAVRSSPEDGDIAMIHSQYLLKVGRLKEAVAEATRSVRDDPLSPANRQAAVMALGIAGRVPEAEQELRDAEVLWPGASTVREARFTLYLRIGDAKEAMRFRESGAPMPSMSPYVGSFLIARANPTPANVELALRDARALYARTPIAISHLSQTLGEFHREEELFPILLNWPYPDKVDQVTDVLFRPALNDFRHDPRFMRVAARLGLLQYWQSSGQWPDFCFDADLPYDCKREAAAALRSPRA